MTNDRFNHLKEHLMVAMVCIQKLENGSQEYIGVNMERMLELELGYSLAEFYRLRGEEPSVAMAWIQKMSKKEGA